MCVCVCVCVCVYSLSKYAKQRQTMNSVYSQVYNCILHVGTSHTINVVQCQTISYKWLPGSTMEVNLSVNYPFPPLEGHVTHFGQCLVKVKVKVKVCVCVCVQLI